MASSSKITFSLAALQQKALQAIDRRISDIEMDLAVAGDQDAFAESVAAWREAEQERVWALGNRLFPANDVPGPDPVSNEELATFAVTPMPKQDVHLIAKMERELKALQVQRAEIVVKSQSLVADESGNIALTTTQLREFFNC